MSSMKDIESYKKLLKDLKSPQGEDLYSHLLETFAHLMTHYPSEAVEKFEEVSYVCKNKGKVDMDSWLRIKEEVRYREESKAMGSFAINGGKLFEKPKLEEGEEPPEKAPAGNVPDLMKQGRIFEWAGIDFGEKEYFLLQKSLAKLAIKSGASKVRFWGKIRGTEKDYYIAESILEGGGGEGEGEEEKPADMEARGSGVNQFVYWVTHDGFSDWKQLPDLTPRDLKASRLIKVLFTGDLERKIITNPYFNGREKHYLRAQIARIHHGTTLVPFGLFKTTEDDPKEIEGNEGDEENKYVPQTETQSSLLNWCHYPKGILKNWRTSHMEPEVPEGVDIEPEELLRQIEAKDPYDQRLKPVTNDSQVENGIPAWNLKLFGDKERQPTLNGKSTHNGIVVLKSLRWPGSATVWKENKWYQIYVGSGLKYETQTFYPVSPPELPADPEDLPGNPEPTPLELPPQPVVADPPQNEGEGQE